MSCIFPPSLNERLGRMIAFVCVLFVAQSALAGSGQDNELRVLNQLYQQVLDTHLSSGDKNGLPANMIDYAAMKADPRLRQLQAMLEAYPKERLDTQAKKMAFYLNAYNILAIAKVCKHWPLFKLKSLGTFYKPVWTQSVGEVCGEKMTLRKLEHQILRKLGDPRVHFALNCASMSCPDLRTEPYTAEHLESQLEQQTNVFLSQSGKGILIEGNALYLSPIFNWFAEDFADHGGVMAFIQPYLPPSDTEWEIAGYLDYDWSVNDHLTGAEKTRIKRASGSTWFN